MQAGITNPPPFIDPTSKSLETAARCGFLAFGIRLARVSDRGKGSTLESISI